MAWEENTRWGVSKTKSLLSSTNIELLVLCIACIIGVLVGSNAVKFDTSWLDLTITMLSKDFETPLTESASVIRSITFVISTFCSLLMEEGDWLDVIALVTWTFPVLSDVIVIMEEDSLQSIDEYPAAWIKFEFEVTDSPPTRVAVALFVSVQSTERGGVRTSSCLAYDKVEKRCDVAKVLAVVAVFSIPEIF